MLILVLADNLLLLYLGWEGVGLCSYLLIGFWYREAANARAAVKAFVVTRIGDTALIIGLFLLASHLGTLQIQEVVQRAGAAVGPRIARRIRRRGLAFGRRCRQVRPAPAAGLAARRHGRSHAGERPHPRGHYGDRGRLPDRAHASPLHPCPRRSPRRCRDRRSTLLIAAGSACVQRDIKRVLAYSTMSQVGYMFLALGVGAWSAAIFHFVTHAFFKALLFLSAGVVIQALDNEHDIFKMGGLRKALPVAFWTFLIGAASLSALPFVTAGFYSKDLILRLVWSSPPWGPWFWGAGTLGAFLTALYSFRLVFVAFFGPGKAIRRTSAPSMIVPLVILAVFSLGAGFLPRTLGTVARRLLPGGPAGSAGPFIQAVGALLPVIGIIAAVPLYLTRRRQTEALATKPFLAGLNAFLFSGWGFDRLYGALLVDPFLWITRINRADFVDLFFRGLAWTTGLGSRALVGDPVGQGQVVRHGRSYRRGGFCRHGGVPVILAVILFIPVCGGVVAWLAESVSAKLPRWVSLVSLAVDFLLTAALWPGFLRLTRTAGPWPVSFHAPWVLLPGVSFHLGLDGTSLVLISLTAFLGCMGTRGLERDH